MTTHCITKMTIRTTTKGHRTLRCQRQPKVEVICRHPSILSFRGIWLLNVSGQLLDLFRRVFQNFRPNLCLQLTALDQTVNTPAHNLLDHQL